MSISCSSCPVVPGRGPYVDGRHLAEAEAEAEASLDCDVACEVVGVPADKLASDGMRKSESCVDGERVYSAGAGIESSDAIVILVSMRRPA